MHLMSVIQICHKRPECAADYNTNLPEIKLRMIFSQEGDADMS